MVRILPTASGERGARIELAEVEAALLASLAQQLVDLVGVPDEPAADPLAALVGIDPHAAPSEDPAVLRLLPDAFVDDDEASAEFRRFTERDLRERKSRDARAVAADVTTSAEGGVVLDLTGERLANWLGMFNDARLVLGSRLGITDDSHDELADLAPDDSRAPLVELYGWLTYVQDGIVQQLLEPPA